MTPEEHTPASEAEIIELFSRLFAPRITPSDLLIGIGDDAAAIEPGVDPDTKFVITADMLVEDVHFRRSIHSPYDIGWRTAVANLSDIAAMGAAPRWGILTLALPGLITTDWLEQFATGLRDAMAKYDAQVIGGDLARSPERVVASLTILGETTGRLVMRTGAELGDLIAVTGYLGGGAAGLALLESDEADLPEDVRKAVIDAHLRPLPRVWAGHVFASHKGIHAMMDISDGLGIDLGRLCEASGVGARMREDLFPIRSETLEVAEALNRDPLEFVNGGEDFELLVVGAEGAVRNAAKVLSDDPAPIPVTILGEIIDPHFGMHLLRVDQTVVDPSSYGWDHFQKR